MSDTNRLLARDVRVRFGRHEVVDGVSLEARPGQVSAVIGPNGSGKTSLLRAIAGLVPSDGELRLGAQDLRQLEVHQRAQQIAYLPQSSALNAMLSVREVVALGRYAHRRRLLPAALAADAFVQRALVRTDTTHLAHLPFPELSGGQRRRVLLARALATGARTLLLDEPSASLDVKHALGLFALLRELAADGYCILVVLHDLDEVQRYADHALLLDAGRVAVAGSPCDGRFVAAAEATYGVTLVPNDRVGFRLGRAALRLGAVR